LALTGELFKLHVGMAAMEEPTVVIYNRAGLDTCGGCNLVRKNQVPKGAVIRDLRDEPRISSAEGRSVEILGVVTRTSTLPGTDFAKSVDLLVAEKLIVPVLLGTPWIFGHVVSISPAERPCWFAFLQRKTTFQSG
jgi:hypothetical protein